VRDGCRRRNYLNGPCVRDRNHDGPCKWAFDLGDKVSYTTDTTRPPEAEVAPAAPPSKVDALRAAIAEENAERKAKIDECHAAIKSSTSDTADAVAKIKADHATYVRGRRFEIKAHRAAIEANRIPAKRKKK